MSNGGSSSTATRPNKPSTAITQLGKRARLDKSESEDTSEEIYESSRDNARSKLSARVSIVHEANMRSTSKLIIYTPRNSI
jgi:hypothetical protein